MTNREWLESLSDEELVDEITGVVCHRCIYKQESEMPKCVIVNYDSYVCKRGVKYWLKAEHKDD